MRRCMLLAAALAAFITGADARIITYTWNQTATTKPGLVFTAFYEVVQGVGAHHADSNQTPPDFGGLVGLYIQGGSYPAVSLADLVPSCDNPGLCLIGGNLHDFGSPDWRIDLPDIFYHATTEIPPPNYVFEWNYIVTATSITLGDDNAAAGCFNPYDCTTTGFWSSDFVPEPWSLFIFAAGILAGFRPARRW